MDTKDFGKGKPEFQPHFIGVGAGKCGTTWLHRQIVQHPEVDQTSPKEMRFFDLHYSEGIDWYKSQFSSRRGKIQGEFSVQYLTCPDAAERIFLNFPNTKIIALLRDQPDMLFSSFQHSIRKGETSPGTSFEDFVLAPEVQNSGYFSSLLEPYFNRFSRESIRVVFLPDFLEETKARTNLENLFRFIGVSDPGFFPRNFSQPVNASVEYRSLGIENLITHTSKQLTERGNLHLLEMLKRSGAPKALRYLNRARKKKPVLAEKMRQNLENFYAESNLKLSQLLGITPKTLLKSLGRD